MSRNGWRLYEYCFLDVSFLLLGVLFLFCFFVLFMLRFLFLFWVSLGGGLSDLFYASLEKEKARDIYLETVWGLEGARGGSGL